jgi:hypothetical protein
VLLEKRIWMAYGRNTAYVGYRLARGDRPVTLQITPLVTYRDFHGLGPGGWRANARAHGSVITVESGTTSAPYRLIAPEGRFLPDGVWWRNVLHREETARGLDDREDLYAPGAFELTVATGDPRVLIATAEDDAALDRRVGLERHGGLDARALPDVRRRDAPADARAGPRHNHPAPVKRSGHRSPLPPPRVPRPATRRISNTGTPSPRKPVMW